MMKPHGIETMALLTETTLEGLRRLAELPDGTPVGVIGNSRTCTDNLLRSLEGLGLDYLVPGFLPDPGGQRGELAPDPASKGSGVRQRSGTQAVEAGPPRRREGYRSGPHPEQGRHRDARPDAPALARRRESGVAQARTLKRFIAASGPASITASTTSAASGTASLTAESIRPST